MYSNPGNSTLQVPTSNPSINQSPRSSLIKGRNSAKLSQGTVQTSGNCSSQQYGSPTAPFPPQGEQPMRFKCEAEPPMTFKCEATQPARCNYGAQPPPACNYQDEPQVINGVVDGQPIAFTLNFAGTSDEPANRAAADAQNLQKRTFLCTQVDN